MVAVEVADQNQFDPPQAGIVGTGNSTSRNVQDAGTFWILEQEGAVEAAEFAIVAAQGMSFTLSAACGDTATVVLTERRRARSRLFMLFLSSYRLAKSTLKHNRPHRGCQESRANCVVVEIGQVWFT